MRRIVLGMIFLIACGRDSGSSGTSTNPAMTVTVEDSGALPACSAANKNQLIYVTTDEVFQTCDGVEWLTINAAGKIEDNIFCNGSLEGTANLYAYFHVAQMTSNDVFVTGGIQTDSFDVSGTDFYSSTQSGAETPRVIIGYDLQGAANAGFWTISIDRSTLITTVKYEDADVAGGSQSWSMPASKCTVNGIRQ